MSIKYVCHKLRDDGVFVSISERRISVYVMSEHDNAEAIEAFKKRVADYDRTRLAESNRRYHERYKDTINARTIARRSGDKEALAAIRAEHAKKMEADRIARKAQQQVERDRKAALHASKRAEIAANNLLARKIKSLNQRTPDQPTKPPPTITWGNVQVQKITHQPGRYEIQEAPALFSGLRIGEYLDQPGSCAARSS